MEWGSRNPVCGDIMKIFLKIENNIITDARFKTFSSAPAIRSVVWQQELVKGKPLKNAWRTYPIVQLPKQLEGPSDKDALSVLARGGHSQAIKDFRKKHRS